MLMFMMHSFEFCRSLHQNLLHPRCTLFQTQTIPNLFTCSVLKPS